MWMQKYLSVSKSAIMAFLSSISKYGTSGFKDTAQQEK